MILHLIKSRKGFDKFVKSYTVSDEDIVVLAQDAVFFDLEYAYIVDEDARERRGNMTNKKVLSYRDVSEKIIESDKILVW